MALKTIFLDRDGVINKEVNYLHTIENFKFIDGVFNACRYFQLLGYEIVIISNQSGISRGYFNDKDYQILTKWMLEQFQLNSVKILDVLYCPHGPKSNCECRKPKPGMILKAKYDYNIDLSNSWLIGDKESDIKAAIAGKIKNTILVRSGHKINESTSSARFIIDSINQSSKVIVS